MGVWEDRARLEGRRAVVVGGGAGIGRAVTTALARAGVRVAFCDNDAEALAATRDALAAEGCPVALAKLADALDVRELNGFFDDVEGEFGSVEILVNVVGGVLKRKFMDTGPADWAADIHRNYGYALHAIHRAVPMMRKAGRGSIVNFTTIEAHRGAATVAVYAGAKAALSNFSRSLAVELGGEGIRVNAIASDHTPSAGNEKALPPERKAKIAALPPGAWDAGFAMVIPLKVRPPTDALGDAVLYLASDLSAYVTGVTLHVDGGTWAASGVLDWPNGDGFSPLPGATAGLMFPKGGAG